ncbi:MAG: sulfite exporter TauE/SafE family protein, partial [Pedobacter sp.]|nr:sulfite exporter TauE/SafE family protein [Pedobacter sp.]
AAATAMIKSGGQKNEVNTLPKEASRKIWKLLLYGVAIGAVTGLLGAGGGFLLIPTLVILMGLPMKQAVGTSLMIIAMNSLLGFTGDLGHFKIDWLFLLEITLIAIAGIFIGGFIRKKIDGSKLKKGFGYFVLLMGCYIIIKEVFLK